MSGTPTPQKTPKCLEQMRSGLVIAQQFTYLHVLEDPKGTLQQHQLTPPALSITHLDLSAASADESCVHTGVCGNPVSLHVFVQPEGHICVSLHCTSCMSMRHGDVSSGSTAVSGGEAVVDEAVVGDAVLSGGGEKRDCQCCSQCCDELS